MLNVSSIFFVQTERCSMYSGTRSSIVIGFMLLACLGPAAPFSHAQGLGGIVENYYPTQAPLGQTTTLNLAMTGGRNNAVLSLEITPSAGITVGALKASDPSEGVVWWTVPITVAKDAPAGPRMLVAVQMSGRTKPVTLTIPDHTPTISDLKIVAAPLAAQMVDFQFAATDQGGSLGDAPRVFFTLGCGNTEPLVGMVKGKVANGVVRASVPNPHTHPKVGAPPYGNKCDLQVRASDTTMFDSNTLKTTIDFK
jgi:hypothetical protein